MTAVAITPGNLTTAGPVYPSTPAISMELAVPPDPCVEVMLVLEDVTNLGPVDASINAVPDQTSIFLQTTLSGVSNPTIQYRFDFQDLGGVPIPVEPQLDWTDGQDHAEVMLHLPCEMHWMLFVEKSATQAVSFANVSAVEGSALVTVELSGDVDETKPVLSMAMGASVLTTTSVPGLPRPWAPALLAALVLIATGAALRRPRTKG